MSNSNFLNIYLVLSIGHMEIHIDKITYEWRLNFEIYVAPST